MEEFFHPLHALFVLDLRQGIFHRIYCIVIGEVHLSGHIGLFIDIENMPFLCRAVKDNLPLCGGQVTEGHIDPHPHFLGDILHQ